MLNRKSVRSRFYRQHIFALPLLALGLVISATVWAYPRLSVEHAEACKNCHISPSGAGARTEYGNFAVAFNELTLPSTKKLVASHYRKPRLGEAVIIGFDTRHLVLDDGSIFRMQTDAYVTIEPLRDVAYHARLSETGLTENFAQLYFEDQKYFVRVGRFYPAFGLRNEDHTSFNRERTGNPPNFFLDGISLGAKVGPVYLTGEYFNPNKQTVAGGHIYAVGTLDPISYLVGASYRYTEDIDGSNQGIPHEKALFGGLAWNRFTTLGEMDLGGKGNDTIVVYGSLTTRVEYGAYLVAEYNFFDGNRQEQRGVDEYLRFSFELYPMPFVQVRPSYTTYTRGVNEDSDEFFLQIHFGY